MGLQSVLKASAERSLIVLNQLSVNHSKLKMPNTRTKLTSLQMVRKVYNCVNFMRIELAARNF